MIVKSNNDRQGLYLHEIELKKKLVDVFSTAHHGTSTSSKSIIADLVSKYNPDVKQHEEKNRLYQTNEQQNKPLMAGFTTQEIFDRLQALNEEYGDFTQDTPQDVLDNQKAKIHVLEDALDYMYRENAIQKDLDEVAYNTYHVMNNAPLPEAFVEADKKTARSIREYKELHEKKKRIKRKYADLRDFEQKKCLTILNLGQTFINTRISRESKKYLFYYPLLFNF